MAEVKTMRLEVKTDLSKSDMELLERDLPRLGPSGLEVLALIRDIASAAERVHGVAVELKLTTGSGLDSVTSIASSTLRQGISFLGLTGRTSIRLDENGIKTVGDLVAKSERELLQLRRFGPTSLDEVRRALQKHGLSLGIVQE